MKVTFEKQIDFNEVPFEVDKVFKNSLKQLETLNSVLQSLDTTIPEEFIEKLDFVRTRLFDIDSSFDDCNNQMRGYLAVLDGEEITKPEEEEEPKSLEEVTKSLDNFEENMKKLMQTTHKPSPSTTSPISMPDPSGLLKQMEGSNNNE